ncbi:class I SAM-dependent methyltransferase [Bradyrhizobium sp. 151]|uniref:class I SAM-dependent methyltransferase n=1 Tax=Bradyrhizobium sp. 151 TaxID=2782626 RepID=UPI001FF85CDE|nr:class I SAM-dependent methyltransferase [Bradyrhizobium sp. 151]MCK1660610.1 methyltransferase domain-containing protein [Bradyrhizobium sp. 151]
MARTIKGCEVCGGSELKDVLDLGRHPLCDDLVPVGNPGIPETYPIDIVFCPTCKTAHQAYQVPKRTLFPSTYHYRARHTADVLNGMRQLMERCEKQAGSLKDLLVLDVGCNDGSLLSIFGERGARTVGVEPTGAAADAKQAGHTVYQDYFAPSLAEKIAASGGLPDIITFTNVFAHIEDLRSVLSAVGALMGPTTLLVIENHYLGSVLDRYQFDTFYHEHPRTYSLTSFRYIAKSLQARIEALEFPARYGGNIRVMMRRGDGEEQAAPELAKVDAVEGGFEQRLLDMAKRIPAWQKSKRAEIEAAVSRQGPLVGKAFPGRAAILVKLLDLDQSTLQAVYEKPGSMKIGHYIPGTRIPILSDDDFDKRPNRDVPLLNLAWHISGEIQGYMRKQGYGGQIIDLFSPEEFERA